MKPKPVTFSILVRERGSDKEVELCKVGSNPAAIVEACKLKMLNVLPKNSEKRIQTPKYDSVRYIAISIAIAIIQLPVLPGLSASQTAHAYQVCRKQQEVRASHPNSYLAYRRRGTEKCWFVSPGHAARKAPKGKVSASAPTRPADPAIGVTARKDGTPAIQTFESRWNLR